MKDKGLHLQQQDLQSKTENKPTKGPKRSEDLDLKDAKKNRSNYQNPPKSKNSFNMKTRKGEKDDVKMRGKENAKEVKDNNINLDKKKFGKDNKSSTKDKQATDKDSPKKGQAKNQEKNNRKQDKGRGAFSKDDMEIEKNKKQKRKEENERVNKSIQTDQSALKSKDDHSVRYSGRNGGHYGDSTNYDESGGYGHRKSDASYNGSDGDGSLKRGFRHHFSREMLEQSADELKTTVEELEKRFDAIENEDEENEYASGNEWKTRFETQTEMNQQLERQILMLENKVEESKKNLKDAGKTPQEGQLFIDLADANPQLVKQLEKEKLGLINSIRDLEWRLDQESKAYHRANDERKQYVIEIQSTKGNIYQIQRQRAAGDATYRTPRVENGGNIPDDQRILDPKKGPIRKTAGVKTLPSLDSV